MYYRRSRRASLLMMYKDNLLFRGYRITDLLEEEGSNAHHLLISLVDKNPKTSDLGLDQKAMDQAIREGKIEDIRDEFPLDWFKHISKIASDFHASKNYLSYFTTKIILEVSENLLSDDPPFERDRKFIQNKLAYAVVQTGILRSIPNKSFVLRDQKLFHRFVDHVMEIAEDFWKKHDYTVFFPDNIRLDTTAYYLSF